MHNTTTEEVPVKEQHEYADMQFDSIKLDADSGTDGSTADIEDDQIEHVNNRRKKKVLRKKIHFRSDFVNEESSSSDEEVEIKQQFAILNNNPSELSWPFWCWYYIVIGSISTFHAAEYCGEKLADFFGITSPKYQYAINEYHRLQEEEREEEETEQREKDFVQKKRMERLIATEGGENYPTFELSRIS